MKNRARVVVPIVILVVGLLAIRTLVALRPEMEPKRPEAVAPVVRVVVAEQIYRAWSILHRHPYHRS